MPNQETVEVRHLFLLGRDGLPAALEFATRGMKVYRRCVLGKHRNSLGLPFHFGSTDKYRRTYIESYLEFKRFVFEHKSQHKSTSHQGESHGF